MRWVDALDAVLDALVADASLAAIDGFSVFRRGEFTEAKIPGVGWTVYSDLKAENTRPIEGQLDVFARGLAEALVIEGRIREVIDRDVPRTLGGVRMRTEITDARDHDDPALGIVHRSLDFYLEPTR